MRIAFWGTSSFVGSVRNAEILEELVRAGIRPAVAITTSPRESGSPESPVKTAADALGIPTLEPASLKDFAGELTRRDIELSIVASYGKILPRDVLSVPRFGSLNIHPSLLPRWRGPTPIQATILEGDAETGVTIIAMDEKMDHGPVIASAEFPGRLLSADNGLGKIQNAKITAPELASKLAVMGARLLCNTLPDWIAGRIQPKTQDERMATYSKMLRKEDGRIEWQSLAASIERMVRAYTPWPGTYTFWQKSGKPLRLHIEAADVADDATAALRPGVVAGRGGELLVGTSEGVLRIRRLKLEGGSSQDSPEFLRGHPGINGATLNEHL